jgi:hypothetical protein
MTSTYKIILKKTDNIIVNDIYSKIKDIMREDKLWLVENLKIYILDHLKIPFYEKKDLEKIIFDYGIQKSIQDFILNKKYYDDIMNIVESDESKIYYGIAFYIIYGYFEYRII